MIPFAFSVEEGLRLALATAETLHRFASFVGEPHKIDLIADVGSFARAAGNFAETFTTHIHAIRAALPADCRRLAAPHAEATR